MINHSQYHAYYRDLGLEKAICLDPRRGAIGVGGIQQGICRVIIQISFPDLYLVIEVDFPVVKQDIPALLFDKEMIIMAST